MIFNKDQSRQILKYQRRMILGTSLTQKRRDEPDGENVITVLGQIPLLNNHLKQVFCGSFVTGTLQGDMNSNPVSHPNHNLHSCKLKQVREFSISMYS